MAEINVKNIPAINEVEGFSPADFTRQLPSEDGKTSLYLDVKYRLLWFRLCNPNGKIDPEIVHVDDKSAVVVCKLYLDRCDPADQYVAKSCAQRFASAEKYGDRYLETAETAAMGRVLAAAGYGTQFCGATDMFGADVCDAPLDLSMAEDSCEESSIGTSRVLHETMSGGGDASAAAASPGSAPTSEPKAIPQKPTDIKNPESLDDYLNSMTLDEAKAVVIDVGYHKGKTLGVLAMQKPGDLEWYVKNYTGRNMALKAGAILLVNAAMQKVS